MSIFNADFRMVCPNCEKTTLFNFVKKDVRMSELRPTSGQVTWGGNCKDCSCGFELKLRMQIEPTSHEYSIDRSDEE